MTNDAVPALKAHGIRASYGVGEIIRGIYFEVGVGEVVVIIGPNGAGKSTFLRALYGLIQTTGLVSLGTQRIDDVPADRRLELGLAFVPQGRCNFAGLTVLQNLEAALLRLPRGKRAAALESTLELFPPLRGLLRRRAGNASGGEQQLVEMAMALVSRPQVVLLDEPTLGLSPIASEFVFDTIKALRKTGTGIVIVEQNARQALEIGDRAYVFEQGVSRIVDRCDRLLGDRRIREVFLGGSVDDLPLAADL